MQTNNNQEEYQGISFTPELLAQSLSLDLTTLQRKMNRMGLSYNREDKLPDHVVALVVEEYAKPHPRRSVEVVESAQQIAQQFNVQININTADMQTKPVGQALEFADIERQALSGWQTIPDKKKTADKLVGILSYLAFIFILLFQMEHVASIGMDVSAFEDSTARKISGWLFAFTFNLTALVMTVKRGVKAKIRLFGRDLSYILLFALLDVIFFVLSAAPIDGQGDPLKWAKASLVGGATAFVIYSFNELITETE